MQKIGLLTYDALPRLSEDDQYLLPELNRHQILYEIINWDQQSPSSIDCSHLWIRSPWNYFLRPTEFIDYLLACEKRGIQVINSTSIVSWNYHKGYLMDLIQWNIPTVPSFIFKKEKPIFEVQKEIQQLAWPAIVLKPTVSGNSHNTFFIKNESALIEKAVRTILNDSDLLAQPYIQSIETDGEISLIYFKVKEQITFSHAVVKTPKPEDFRVQTEFGGRTQSFNNIPNELHQICDQLFIKLKENKLNDWFYARIDIVDWNIKPVIGEVEMIEPSLYLNYSEKAPELAVLKLMDFIR